MSPAPKKKVVKSSDDSLDAAKKPRSSTKKSAASKEKSPEQTAMKLKEKKEETGTMKLKGIRIRLSAFDHNILDEAGMKIIDTAVRTGAVVHGPIPLPTKIRKFTVNRSTFVKKDARDQFEMRIHRRLIDLSETTFKTVDALQNLSLPAGVSIDIKMG